jgi:hypothetical protein
MQSSPNPSPLSPNRRRLVLLIQSVYFGRIEQLTIRNGEPVFDPPPRVVRDLKFGGDNGPRPESASVEFSLKPQMRELLEELTRLGDGTIEAIEVKHGAPFLMRVVGSAD